MRPLYPVGSPQSLHSIGSNVEKLLIPFALPGIIREGLSFAMQF